MKAIILIIIIGTITNIIFPILQNMSELSHAKHTLDQSNAISKVIGYMYNITDSRVNELIDIIILD